jgi:hypothetical protein
MRTLCVIHQLATKRFSLRERQGEGQQVRKNAY